MYLSQLHPQQNQINEIINHLPERYRGKTVENGYTQKVLEALIAHPNGLSRKDLVKATDIPQPKVIDCLQVLNRSKVITTIKVPNESEKSVTLIFNSSLESSNAHIIIEQAQVKTATADASINLSSGHQFKKSMGRRSQSLLSRFDDGWASSQCKFYFANTEDLQHLFMSCPKKWRVWIDVFNNFNPHLTFTQDDVRLIWSFQRFPFVDNTDL
ncbi:hypothetical protein G6F47_005770 [Rhizopus delemar]|nr:hypothetical protein G6F49_006203 [Rhizopus delemar]KAG1581488.1 hypothetical protein G6F48_009767 [Rhizopus delemar]KAG1599149.1 hypothetical protein G6F47_005770 [Rhizopus delemar]KAG1631844.1 hypothetical protein G6F45_004540 [Rhizopus arrhizus]KAG1641303.1 hypothetical protein G6F44_005961 [Rhizopus delemar]